MCQEVVIAVVMLPDLSKQEYQEAVISLIQVIRELMQGFQDQAVSDHQTELFP